MVPADMSRLSLEGEMYAVRRGGRMVYIGEDVDAKESSMSRWKFILRVG